MAKPCPTEYYEQIALVHWLEINNIKFTSIPNSTYTESYKQKAINRKSGLRKGLPDLFCIINDSILFIELKRANKTNKPSLEQAKWIECINRCNNAQGIVAYGSEHAISQIHEIFGEDVRGNPDDFVDQLEGKLKGMKTDLPF